MCACARTSCPQSANIFVARVFKSRPLGHCAFAPDAPTPERRQIDAATELLRQSATSLAKLFEMKRIQKGLSEVAPPRMAAIGAEIEVGDTTRSAITSTELIDPLSLPWAQIKGLASEGAGELVESGDYFEPMQDFVQIAGDEVQRGEFIVANNPELLPIGNFVCRCFLRRLNLLIAPLGAVRAKLATAMSRTRQQFVEWPTFEATWDELHSTRSALERLLLTGTDGQLRNSCIVLTQIYAAFHATPELEWLGLRPDQVARIHSLRGTSTGRGLSR